MRSAGFGARGRVGVGTVRELKGTGDGIEMFECGYVGLCGE